MFKLNLMKNKQISSEATQKSSQELTTGETMEQPSSPQSHQSIPVEALEEVSPTSSPQIEDEPTHFDSFIEEDIQTTESIEEGLSPAHLRREDFKMIFIKGFGGLSRLTKRKAFKIPNSDVDVEDAHACADAIYDTILDIPALHFLLNPSNKWIERSFSITMFTIGMRAALRTERAETVKEEQGAQPARSSTPSQDGEPDNSQAAALGA